MGCGSSTVGVSPDGHVDGQNGQMNGHVTTGTKKKQNIVTDSNGNRQDISSNNPVPRGIAFEVCLDDRPTASLIAKHPPRLKKLEPLNLPKLTPEMLAQKQKLADEKRELALQKKIKKSQKSSKRRNELLKAREFEEQRRREEQMKIMEQLKLAELKREAKLEEIKERQRLKEERARRAREKAKRLQGDPDVSLDVEKDETYNNSDTGSWLDEDNERSRKKLKPLNLRPTVSTSTIDSFENAFQRPPGLNHAHAHGDDFFDS
ncbi:uncharacterized protein CCDC198-like [Gigantopelta aegis]|uniref:uncharacterized protein CCDC198-like n=1 Tax=Gigantopelta aegis TaxID=1735272 RepID=UPI001B88A7B2|nr:uncharacterized protein CCDC198-like [Gigantopelta aegis]